MKATIPKLDAVLPLLARDLDRFELLDISLWRKFPSLGTCWVICRDDEMEQIRSALPKRNYRQISETELVPELPAYRLIASFLGRKVPGWYLQQILKFAIAPRIETPFYLTLDADVVCLRTVDCDDLVRQGRAIVRTTTSDLHPDWYRWASRILKCSRPPITHGVTPALFSREAVLELQKDLEGRVHPAIRAACAVLPERTKRLFTSWPAFLLRNMPWTEYTLYHTFLYHRGWTERFHWLAGEKVLYDNEKSLWVTCRADTWKYDGDLDELCYFIVVQSNTGIDAATVQKALIQHFE